MTDTTTPDYYRSPSGNIQAIDIIQEYEMGFALGNVLKYIIRAGNKDGTSEIEDLEKAKTYLEYRINYIRKGAADFHKNYKEYLHCLTQC